VNILNPGTGSKRTLIVVVLAISVVLAVLQFVTVVGGGQWPDYLPLAVAVTLVLVFVGLPIVSATWARTARRRAAAKGGTDVSIVTVRIGETARASLAVCEAQKTGLTIGFKRDGTLHFEWEQVLDIRIDPRGPSRISCVRVDLRESPHAIFLIPMTRTGATIVRPWELEAFERRIQGRFHRAANSNAVSPDTFGSLG
jgi:hypothetical protein